MRRLDTRQEMITAGKLRDRISHGLESLGVSAHWTTLRRWGRSRLLATSYIWLIFVPLAAKIMEPLAGKHDFHIFGSTFNLHLALPFSWTWFYAMALFFATAQAIYFIRCPSFIREFESFRDYRAQHAGNQLIAQQFGQLLFWEPETIPGTANRKRPFTVKTMLGFLVASRSEELSELARDILNRLETLDSSGNAVSNNKEKLSIAFDALQIGNLFRTDADTDDVFELIRSVLNYGWWRWRIACWVCIALGLVSFLVVVWENTYYVLRAATA